MYDPKSNTSFSTLNPQIQVRLDRQQEMTQSELHRQQMAWLMGETPKASSFPRLGAVLATLLNLLTL